jgi:hypothetical protein
MFFNGTNYYDGAVGVTQCSIPSERGMDYIIDTSLQVSTRKAVGRQAVRLYFIARPGSSVHPEWRLES